MPQVPAIGPFVTVNGEQQEVGSPPSDIRWSPEQSPGQYQQRKSAFAVFDHAFMPANQEGSIPAQQQSRPSSSPSDESKPILVGNLLREAHMFACCVQQSCPHCSHSGVALNHAAAADTWLSGLHKARVYTRQIRPAARRQGCTRKPVTKRST